MRILLTELRREADAEPAPSQSPLGVIYEIAAKREQG
jgi:hypothetical protein